MSKVLNEVVAANQNYAAGFGEKKNLPIPPDVNLPFLHVWMQG